MPPIQLAAECGRMVFAHYHSWWGTPHGPTGRWLGWHCPIFPPGQESLVRRDRLGRDEPLVSHDPDRFVGPGIRDFGINNKPLLGPYDSTDPDVVRRHVEWALGAGIDGFIHDWIGGSWGAFEDPRTWETDQSDRSLSVLLDVVEREYPSFNVIALLDIHWIREYTPEETLGELEYLYATHMTRPGYLKVAGKPLLPAFKVARHHTSEDWRGIKRAMESRGRPIHLFGDDLESASVFDGLCLYSIFGLTTADSGEAALAEASAAVMGTAAENGQSVIAPVMPGFDASSYIHPDSWAFVLPREDGAHYGDSWSAWADAGADWIGINSWNEWYEKSNIEPDRDWGDKFLQLTKPYAAAFKEGRSLATASGETSA